MYDPLTVGPHLSVLSAEQIARIHRNSLHVLSSVGVRLDSRRARDAFEDALGRGAVDDRTVHLSPDLVEWAIEVAPSTVDVCDRCGERAFQLGQSDTRFGIGVTNLFYQDPRTDEVVPYDRARMAASVRLGHTLDSFDLVSTVGVLQDTSPDEADLYATLEMVGNTTKPLVLLVSEPDAFPRVLDMLEALCGNLSRKPFVLPYVNPITPLVLNRGTVEKMSTAARRGLPIIYSSYGMAGTSTPITPAGSLTVLNAELLAGLTLSQLMAEGTPVVLGILPMAFDMKAMIPVFDASSFLLNVACAEMMAHYGIPHCGTSGSGDGWSADLVAGGTMWTNHLTSVLGRVGLCPFVGSNFGSKVFSPHAAVYADDVIAQVRRLARGFELSSETVALDEVRRVGPGGDFLASERTFQLFRDAVFRSDIFPTLDLETWRERGSPRAEDLLRRRTEELLENPRVPKDHAELMARGEAFIAASAD